MRVRIATVEDASTLARFRVSMFRDMRPDARRHYPSIQRATLAYLRRAIPAGEFVGFLAEERGEPVACGGLLVRVRMPAPTHPRGTREAHVINMFTKRAHRRRGFALAVMRAILRWCGRNGFGRLTLHASRKGRPLYVALGFRAVEEMRLDVTPSRRRGASRPRR